MSDDIDAAGDSNGDEDIDLALLSDEDLTAQMHDDLNHPTSKRAGK